MKKMIRNLTAISMMLIVLSFASSNLNFAFQKTIDIKLALKAYLEKSGVEPAKYVIDKFKDKDIVILSESNKLKHEVEFVKDLIPQLYYAGVYTLAMEFGVKEDQPLVDKLLSNEYFDKGLAYKIMREYKENGIWGYQEYYDIFKAAWYQNQGLPGKSPKFRIVFLSEKDQKATNYFDKSKKMADILQSTVLKENNKVLVYITALQNEKCSNNALNTGDGSKRECLGNILCKNYPQKVFSISFHSPWTTVNKNTKMVDGITRPLNGEIDEALLMYGSTPVAFDIAESPIKNLSDKISIFASLNKDYTMNCVCDGYIYLKPYDQFELTSWMDDFIDEDYLMIVQEYFKTINPDLEIVNISYANDLCAAMGWNMFELMKNLKMSDSINTKTLIGGEK